ncbi:MAG: hypothetical protein ACTHZ5_01460 [Micrococcaceae bacterium]
MRPDGRPLIGALGPDTPTNLIRQAGVETVDLLDLVAHAPVAHHDAQLRARRALGAAADEDSVSVLALLISDPPVSVLVVSSAYQAHLWVHQVLQQWRREDPTLPESLLVDLKHSGRPSTLRYNTVQLRKMQAQVKRWVDNTAVASPKAPAPLPDADGHDRSPAEHTVPLVLSGSQVRDPELRRAMAAQGYRIVAEDHGGDFWDTVTFDDALDPVVTAARAHALRPPLAPAASPTDRSEELLRILRRQTKPGHVLFCTRTHDDAPFWDRTPTLRALEASGIPWSWSGWYRDDEQDPATQHAALRAALPRTEDRR